MTKKELRKAIKSLDNMEVLVIDDWGKVQNIFGRYAICVGEDDSDPMTDYSAWSYGWKIKRIVDYYAKCCGIE